MFDVVHDTLGSAVQPYCRVLAHAVADGRSITLTRVTTGGDVAYDVAGSQQDVHAFMGTMGALTQIIDSQAHEYHPNADGNWRSFCYGAAVGLLDAPYNGSDDVARTAVVILGNFEQDTVTARFYPGANMKRDHETQLMRAAFILGYRFASVLSVEPPFRKHPPYS
jgi:hypothetical protein